MKFKSKIFNFHTFHIFSLSTNWNSLHESKPVILVSQDISTNVLKGIIPLYERHKSYRQSSKESLKSDTNLT